MRAIFIIKEWRDSNLSVVKRDNVGDGIFSEGHFFSGTLHLESEDEQLLKEQIKRGFYPVFIANRPEED